MKRDNNGRFVKAVKTELVVGDKITSFGQLKEGMVVDFVITSRVAGVGSISGAIIVEDNGWYAVHNSRHAKGACPISEAKMLGKKYGWCLGTKGDIVVGGDYSDMVLRGWHKKEEVKPVEKVEVENKFKIGDMVKHNSSFCKAEVIGVYKDLVWLKVFGWSTTYEVVVSPSLSPWVEPLKYKKGDLVLMNGMNVLEVFEVMANGYRLKDLDKEKAYDHIYKDRDILRKVGVATPS
jgi:hypothetical protein